MPRLLAIGDIHGCTLQLDALLEAVNPQPEDQVIFLGDLVDRGPDSRGAIERAIDWTRNRGAICLRGNHEFMMLQARSDAADRRMWLTVGGNETLASYSKIPGRMGQLTDIPDEHWDFLTNDLQTYCETNSAIFVHAGLNPNLALPEQEELELYWDFLAKPVDWPDGRLVIVGHTSQKSGTILDLGNTICIDTHAYGGKPLTCLDAISLQYWQADLLGRVKTGQLPPR